MKSRSSSRLTTCVAPQQSSPRMVSVGATWSTSGSKLSRMTCVCLLLPRRDWSPREMTFCARAIAMMSAQTTVCAHALNSREQVSRSLTEQSITSACVSYVSCRIYGGTFPRLNQTGEGFLHKTGSPVGPKQGDPQRWAKRSQQMDALLGKLSRTDLHALAFPRDVHRN